MAYEIFFVNPDPVVYFAASELKKYLRMIMPRCGEVPLSFDPKATGGFRLGLMSDFGLDPAVEDLKMDDVLYVKTDDVGGVIAGSNPRSVLLAVYKYLREQGCLWLFPGPDGESIPVREALDPVDLLHRAAHRYRGQCNEGAETQSLMMDAIDFTPKTGMNTFMIEFDIPKVYYNRAYEHTYDSYENEGSLSDETVLQWKRQCEAEIAKRGLLFHDMGHGWTAEPFGFESKEGWVSDKDAKIPDEKRKHLAMINGVREFFNGVALNTNVCMSNPETRQIMARYIADYAEKQNNVDFLHVWLADASNNHCECDECRKKDTSDWYVILLNDIDAELTARKLETRIVFIAYVDTVWAPHTESIRNTGRFTMLFAPITRRYTETYGEAPAPEALRPYDRNRLKLPEGMAENLAYLQDWKKMWKGDCFCYEYHFWMACYYDLGVMYLARILHDDVRGLKQNGLSGIVEDGSQAAFFPNGFQYFVYAESLFDGDKTFEAMTEEFFSHAYGDGWESVVEYLQKLSDTSDFGFVKGEKSADPSVGKHYDPSLAERFKSIPALVEEFMPVVEAHRKSGNRCRDVNWDLLRWHGKFVRILSKGLAAIAVNDRETSSAAFFELVREMAPLQYLHPTVYDHLLCCHSLKRVIDPDRKYQQMFL